MKKLWLVINEHQYIAGAHVHILFQEQEPSEEQALALEKDADGKRLRDVFVASITDLSKVLRTEPASRASLLEAINDLDFARLLATREGIAQEGRA